MNKNIKNIPASVLARLKNMADKERIDFNFLLLRYIQERFLSRLAATDYVNQFTLKGGFLLLAFNIEKARPTRDIDFLGTNISNDRQQLEQIIKEIASVDQSDGVVFVADSIKSEVIKEEADYEGIRIKLAANIGSARNTVQIDFGFGDVVTPHPLAMNYPTLLDNENVNVMAYSRETIVAEKFETIVKLTTFNSRMKDFYDISFLAHEFNFKGDSLQQAIRNTFKRRQTSLEAARDILDSGLGTQSNFQQRWEAFRKRTKIAGQDDFKNVFDKIRSFLLPVINLEIEGTTMNQIWNRKSEKWE